MRKQIVKIMCGSDETHPYPVRSFTYRAEQVRANEVQKADSHIAYRAHAVPLRV